jgi:O-antigen ligase
MTERSKALAGSNSVASYLLFATAAGAPFPFGSEDATIVLFWCILLGVGAIAAPVRSLGKQHQLLLLGIGFIVICYYFVLHEQLSDSPWIANPESLWAETSRLLGVNLTPSVSISKYGPFYSLGPPFAAILAMTLGLVVGSDRNRARQLLLIVGWSGTAYALYGIISTLVEPNMILWRERHGTGFVTGTFVSENTAATYFGSCTAIWLVALSDQIRERLPKGPLKWEHFSLLFAFDGPGKMARTFFAFLSCFTALLMTGSRAGVTVALVTFVVAVTAYFRRDLSKWHTRALLILIASGAVLLLVQFLGGGVNLHFNTKGLDDEGRIATYRSTLQMIADHPWFGTGLGTFAWGFPRYRSAADLTGVWDLAHSTPLELAADVGIPLASVIALGWILVLLLLMRAATRPRREGIAVPLAALSVALIGLSHSTVDFSLQIPGYAIVAFGVVGAGLGQALGSRLPK